MQGHSDNLNAVAAIVLVAASTGVIKNNIIIDDVATFSAMNTGTNSMIFAANQRTDVAGGTRTSAMVSTTVTVANDNA